MNYALSTRWVRPGINSKLLCWEGNVVGKIRFWIYVQLWWAIHYGRINTMTCYDIRFWVVRFRRFGIHEQWRSMTSFLGQFLAMVRTKGSKLGKVSWNPGYLTKCDTLDVQIFCVFICIDTFVFIFSCQMQNSFHNYLHVQYTSILYFYIRGEFEPWWSIWCFQLCFIKVSYFYAQLRPLLTGITNAETPSKRSLAFCKDALRWFCMFCFFFVVVSCLVEFNGGALP